MIYTNELKHLFTYTELLESTSAGSHDRGTDIPPFKFSKNYDPRIGYTKNDFFEDLLLIYNDLKTSEKKEFMDIIFKYTGLFRISGIKNLDQDIVDILTKKIEEFLSSKAEYKPIILPDGFILCFERLKNNNKLCDVYYSPFKSIIKICYIDSYPEIEEKTIPLDKFNPLTIKVSINDFNKTIEKCNNFSKRLK